MTATGTAQRRQRASLRRERDEATRSGRRRAQRRASLLDLVLQAVLGDRVPSKRRRDAVVVPSPGQPQSWSRGETPSQR
jgi:hypothetical protein